ncbi:MAG: T9SS type A sorting domain-containing protein [Calditrichaeota bacterium]|nr:T9SS type A sorting domain-containing protein [Calditrichota bacterium]
MYGAALRFVREANGKVSNSIFMGNQSSSGAVVNAFGYSNDANIILEFDKCVIAGNISTSRYPLIQIWQRSRIEGCTIFDNDLGPGTLADLSYQNQPTVVRNTMILRNVAQGGVRPMAISRGDISYCNIEGGRNAITSNNLTWGPGNFDVAPIFADPDEGDYRLAWANYPTLDGTRSPGIDAGDPASGWDTDGSRRDIGALPFYQRGGEIIGQVTRLLDGAPVAGARVRFGDQIPTTSGFDGWFRILNALPRRGVLSVIATGYVDYFSDSLFVPIGEELSWNLSLRHAEFTIDRRAIDLTLEPGDSAEIALAVQNGGTAQSNWTSTIVERGVIGNRLGDEVLRLNLSENFRSDRFRGVALIDSLFYCVGALEAVNPPRKLIYILNRQGDFLEVMNQPESQSQLGMTDLAYGGRLLWGAQLNRVFGFDLNGAGVFVEFDVTPNPAQAVAYDSDRDEIWVCAVASNIFCYNRAGVQQRSVNRLGLRIYGLEYINDDPDGYCLYALTHQPGCLYKFHSETGDTIRIFGPDPRLGTMQGLHITPGIYPFPSLAGWTIDIRHANQDGDHLVGLHLGTDFRWVTLEPNAGTILAGERINSTLTLSARDLQRGLFEGAVIFRHNAIPFETELPFALRVEPNAAPEGDALPLTFALHPVYPNPFNSRATVTFDLPERAASRILLFDLSGRVVSLIESGPLEAGRHRIALDAANLPSGVYGLRLEDGRRSQSRKVVVLK